MKVIERAIQAMKENFICDRCLGRAFAQLLRGMTDEERGRILRCCIAMLIDSGEKIEIDTSNLYGIKLHLKKIKPEKPKECWVCKGVLEGLEKKAKLIAKKLKKYEYETFLVGCRLTPELIEAEQELWNRVGIEWCESIKTEINRELGKELEKLTGKRMDRKFPDITIVFDFNSDYTEINLRSLYIYGKYQKLVRGIPQTKWKRKIFPTSVQEVIEKPFLKQAKAERSSFHGSGREDIDVRCLGWRPFVLELINPLKRKVDLKKARKEINKSKKVRVKDLKVVDREVVKKIKFADYDKTYRAVVEFEKPVENLKRLKELEGAIISQKTPTRVLRRRSDRIRKRKVKRITYKLLSKKRVELEITAQSGLYVKELITGNEGRTEPSISSLINNKVKNVELDVIKIHGD
jgi:tRNA pseudouridine synthase 10